MSENLNNHNRRRRKRKRGKPRYNRADSKEEFRRFNSFDELGNCLPIKNISGGTVLYEGTKTYQEHPEWVKEAIEWEKHKSYAADYSNIQFPRPVVPKPESYNGPIKRFINFIKRLLCLK